MEQIVKNKYHGGKIYTLRSPSTDKIYIGSTIQPLYKRKSEHFVRKTNDISKLDDFYIELLEDFKCENKDQLNKREGELIRLHSDKCVNKVIAGRSRKDYKIDNKDAIKEWNKTYQESYQKTNKEKIKEYQKKYREKI